MVDRDELLCDTLEEFLLECTGDKVEEVSELPKMLADIFYLSDKEELLEQTTRCEILDIDDGFVTHDEVVGDEIHIHYSLDFILQTSIGPEPVWRVQGSARMELSIPDITVTDWSVFDSPDEDFFDLYEEHKKLVRFHSIEYSQVECDTL